MKRGKRWLESPKIPNDNGFDYGRVSVQIGSLCGEMGFVHLRSITNGKPTDFPMMGLTWGGGGINGYITMIIGLYHVISSVISQVMKVIMSHNH